MEVKKEELLRFIRWISEEPAFWYFVICDGGISTEDAIKLIDSLIKNEFYILVPIVIGHTRSMEIENLLNKLCLNKLCESWNRGKIYRGTRVQLRASMIQPTIRPTIVERTFRARPTSYTVLWRPAPISRPMMMAAVAESPIKATSASFSMLPATVKAARISVLLSI